MEDSILIYPTVCVVKIEEALYKPKGVSFSVQYVWLLILSSKSESELLGLVFSTFLLHLILGLFILNPTNQNHLSFCEFALI